MPGFDGDAGVTKEVRVVGHAVDHVVVDVEHLSVGVVRILRLGRADVRGSDVHIRMESSAAAATEEVAATRQLRITGDRSISEAVELAKQYSTEKSGRFVNGLLARIAEQVRAS